jgi:hypothetical protein
MMYKNKNKISDTFSFQDQADDQRLILAYAVHCKLRSHRTLHILLHFRRIPIYSDSYRAVTNYKQKETNKRVIFQTIFLFFKWEREFWIEIDTICD